MRKYFFIAALCIIVLSSCAFSEDLARHSREYDEFVQRWNEKKAEEAAMLAAAEETQQEEEPETLDELAESYGLVIEDPSEDEVADVVESVQESPVEEQIEPADEIIEEVVEEATEPFLDASFDTPVEVEIPVAQEVEEVPKKTVLQSIEDTIKGEGEPKEAYVYGNVLPMWFVYTCAVIILAILYTLCYISRQKRWRDRN